jgi:uncharacterized protein (TIGR03437 family)
LAGTGGTTTVDFDGVTAEVLSAWSFQVNAVVPATLAPGPHVLTLRSPFGTAQQTVTVATVAPAIFLIGSPPAAAIVNPDTSINGPLAPLPRGQYLVIYATGLGAVTQQGNLSVVSTTVSVVLNGQEIPAQFAGLTPGYAGLYQVNVTIPSNVPPGLGLSLTLKQGERLSNEVSVAIQ